MKPTILAIIQDTAVQVPLLLWLGLALLLAGLFVAFMGHRPKRSRRPPPEPRSKNDKPGQKDLR